MALGFIIFFNATLRAKSLPTSDLRSFLIAFFKNFFVSHALCASEDINLIVLCNVDVFLANCNDFEHGYRSILHHVFGDMIIFENEIEALHLRGCLAPLFEGVHPQTTNKYVELFVLTCRALKAFSVTIMTSQK